MKTKPNKFESEEQFIDLLSCFLDELVQNDYNISPTQTEFCKWLSVNFKDTDRKTIYNTLTKIFPKLKKIWEQMISDVIAQGAMLGKYNSTMSIFALKNWCGWADKIENTNANFNIDAGKEKGLSEYLSEIKEMMQDG